MNTIIALLAFVGTFKAGESTITGWTKPVIDAPTGSGTLAEKINDGVTTGIADITITATANGTVAYAIESQTPISPGLAIDSSTGDVNVTSGTVDYSSAASFTLVVTASDDNSTFVTATVTLSVNAAPSFSSDSTSRCIADGATEGTDLIDLTATDENPGTNITYTIASGNNNTDFAITATGVVEVGSGKTLNMTATSTYTLVITAADDSSIPLTATTTVTATVSAICSGAAAFSVTFMTVLSALIVSLQ